MRQIFIASTVILLSLSFAGCKADTPWPQDCGAFVQTLAELAPKASGDNTKGYGDKFKGKEVTWNLNFKEINGENLQFDLEPFGIKYVFFSGKPVMIGFKPAPETSEGWKTITPGSQVKISGIIANVFFSTMTPGNNPGKQVPAALVSIENVKRIQD